MICNCRIIKVKMCVIWDIRMCYVMSWHGQLDWYDAMYKRADKTEKYNKKHINKTDRQT